MKFEGSADYVATPDLTIAVNAAITLERPLLVKGEPGTGKTELARQIAGGARPAADRMAREVDDQGRAGALRVRRGQPPARQPARRRTRPRRAQLHPPRAALAGLRRRGQGRAADRRDRQGRHRVPERPPAGARPDGVLRLRDRRDDPGAAPRPIVIITSNNEKELPDAFLRRCFFHYIRFPDAETLARIVAVHFPGIKPRLVRAALTEFFEIRETPGPEEEALDLGGARLAEAARRRGPRRPRTCAAIRPTLLPRLHGALLKNEQDVHLFERLAFMSRGRRS